MAFNEDSSGSGHDEPWIQWFCGLKGHEMFCEVERSYIEDGFNLYGLRACVSNFSDCLDLILDRIGPDDSDDSHLTQSACTLYGLIHARYIITAHGLDAMYNKYAAKEFGTCPLAQCQGQPVLPVGLKDEMGADTVKIFCPKCQCVYHPPPIRSRSSSHHGAGAAGVDGAAFGTTFPHLFLMTFSNLVPDPLPPNSAYVPRVFGFRVHMSARQRNTPAGTVAAAPDTNNNPKANNSKSRVSMRKSSSSAVAAAKKEAAPTDAAAAAKNSPPNKAPNAKNDDGSAAPSIKSETADTSKPTAAKLSSNIARNNNNKTGGSNKRRSDGEESGPKKDGFLVDSSAVKRRKRQDG
ncbi:kinase II subunit beta [Seminavis robusta]|uniref:Casein kinase II subunit beta n=1 Tax=Seminavis robusta TaxID=568900 RepID=A0A9N8EDL8_9STRA|nr:kinase II subunit beta [Seminavis robusta]|eukprot:Sro968_g226110.1 kinase II subunit beta (350) ;mRNA; r:38346-39632